MGDDWFSEMLGTLLVWSPILIMEMVLQLIQYRAVSKWEREAKGGDDLEELKERLERMDHNMTAVLEALRDAYEGEVQWAEDEGQDEQV